MPTIETHKVNDLNAAFEIEPLGSPGAGGAPVHYRVSRPSNDVELNEVVHLVFQNGPPADGINCNVTNEILLAILRDRLEGFQRGPFACDDNESALSHLMAAQEALEARTKRRMTLGVEGKHLA